MLKRQIAQEDILNKVKELANDYESIEQLVADFIAPCQELLTSPEKSKELTFIYTYLIKKKDPQKLKESL